MRRLDDLGVAFALAEGCNIAPDRDVASYAPLLEAYRELGARQVNIVSFEPDLARDFDQMCKLVELAGNAGLAMCAEFSARPGRPKLDQFMLRLEQAGGVPAIIDAMHFFAAGQRVEDLSRYAPTRFVQLQICDIRLGEVGANYMEAALHERLPPGEGDLPLAALVAALASEITISMEIPQRTLALSGIPHLERVRAAAARCRAVM
jgi:sugar phosphate isomerase/epimerase